MSVSVTPTNGNLVAAVPDPFAYKTLEHSTFAPPPEPRRCPPPRPSRRAQVKVTYFRSINQKPSIRRPLRIGYQIVLANFQVVAPETGSTQQIRFTGADQPAFARRISRLSCTHPPGARDYLKSDTSVGVHWRRLLLELSTRALAILSHNRVINTFSQILRASEPETSVNQDSRNIDIPLSSVSFLELRFELRNPILATPSKICVLVGSKHENLNQQVSIHRRINIRYRSRSQFPLHQSAAMSVKPCL